MSSTLQGYKSPVTSMGIMGPAIGGVGYGFGWFMELPWLELGSVLWAIGSAIYGRYSATKKIAPLLTIALLAILLAPGFAFAQEIGAVEIPYGNWVIAMVDVLLPLVLLVLASVSAWVVQVYVPPWLQQIAGAKAQQRVSEVLEQAVRSAAAQVKGAALGKKLSVPVANEVLRRAGQYAVNQAPELIKEATGGDTESLKKMLLARMEGWGIMPTEYNEATAKKATKPGEFTFESATKKGLGN